MIKFPYWKKSFSLVELSIVMAIMAILISSSLSLLQGRLAVTRRRDDDERIKLIKESLDLYFKRYQRLPCPASQKALLSDPTFGAEAKDDKQGCSVGRDPFSTSSSNSGNFASLNYTFTEDGISSQISYTGWLFGSIPTKALGLPDSYAFDSYGNRITYVALDSLASYKTSTDPRYDTKALVYTRMELRYPCINDDFFGLAFVSKENPFPACGAVIKSSDNGTIFQGTENGLAYVIIGHGRNGYGAVRSDGSHISFPANDVRPGSAFEKKNSTGYYVINHHSTALEFYQGSERDGFDDIVQWSTIADLLIKNNLGSLVYCHLSTYRGQFSYYANSSSFKPIAPGGTVDIPISTGAGYRRILCVEGGIWRDM